MWQPMKISLRCGDRDYNGRSALCFVEIEIGESESFGQAREPAGAQDKQMPVVTV